MAKGTKVAATTAGKAKAALKALEGYPSIFRHLAGEHAEVAAIMKRIAKSNGDGDRQLFEELRTNLLAHAHAEEHEFYSMLRSYAELEGFIERSVAEHRQVELMLERLGAGDRHSALWKSEFEQLVQAVEKHVEFEEKTLFPQARDLLTHDQADAIEQRYEIAEQREKAALG